ncbi:MAG: glycoside hydrolase family 127 protein [Pirellulales bacterium]
MTISVRSATALGAIITVATGAAWAGDRGLVDTTRSPESVMYMADLDDVRWTGGLLGERFAACRGSMIPYLWDVLRDPTESHAWDNFLMAAGEGEGRGDGRPHGPPFNDGDFLKWLEALVQAEAVAPPDPASSRQPSTVPDVDQIIAVIAKAQREDGYLHTPTIIRQRRRSDPPKEFADREHFETYNMGHLMTTACVHHRATGKTSLLDCGRKAADYLEKLAREKPEELARNAICPSHCMGVAELYRTTRDPRYLELAKRLIDIRSLVPPEVGSDHNQDRVPVREATAAVGHAVRGNYLYAGVADLYAEDGDKTLLAPLLAIDRDVASHKRYVTGMTGAIYDGASPDGVPSTQHASIKTVHQAYGRDYQLPNLTAYNETCATIGYGMWLWRMLLLTGEARYADLFEETLYNGILPGVSLDGRSYFYVNPLRKLHDFRVPMRWSRTRMATIPSSFCCPPNVVRTIAEAHNYIYALSPGTLWVHLYAASTLDTKWIDGGRIRLRQETDYPWSGDVSIAVDEAPEREITIKLRIPGWLPAGGATIRVNGSPIDLAITPGTYAAITRRFQAGDRLDLSLDMAPAFVEAHPAVEEAFGQVTLRRGPLIYCLESNDLPEGVRLDDVTLSLAESLGSITPRPTTIAGTTAVALVAKGQATGREKWPPNELYRTVQPFSPRPIDLTFIPYYAWGNRGDTEMTVWLPAR